MTLISVVALTCEVLALTNGDVWTEIVPAPQKKVAQIGYKKNPTMKNVIWDILEAKKCVWDHVRTIFEQILKTFSHELALRKLLCAKNNLAPETFWCHVSHYYIAS